MVGSHGSGSAAWVMGLAPKLLLAGLGALLALAAAEAALRATADEELGFHVWRPNSVRRLRLAAGSVEDEATSIEFRANALGLRGDPLPAGDGPRVLCVGGSTTECLAVDQRAAWPLALQGILRERWPDAWVGNAGRSGLDSRDHVVQLTHLLPRLPELDLVVVLAGINDLTPVLSGHAPEGRRFEPGDAEDPELVARSFEERPRRYGSGVGWLKGTELYRAARRLRDRWFPGALDQRDASGALERWRAHRAAASGFRSELPPLEAPLAAYEHNLRAVVELCRAAGVEVLLLTQPSIWREDLPPELEARTWAGGVGEFMQRPGAEYHDVAAMARAMEACRAATLRAADGGGCEAFDLDAGLPRDGSVFYDDVHFHRAGSLRVAELVAGHLDRSEAWRRAVETR